MASHEALFRNSLWSHGNGDISLRSFDDLEPRHNAEGERRRRALEPVSKFSSDSDDDDSDYVDYYSSPHISSLHSDSSRRSERRARNREPAAPLAISRVYTSEQQPREYVAPRILSNAEQQEELPRRLQPKAPAQRNPVRLEEPDMSSLWETLLVTTICIAHLCARELVPCILHSGFEHLEIDSTTEAGIGQTLPIMKGVGSHFRIANDSDLSVSIAGYAVALGTCILITSRLGETFGHKRIFIVGLVWSAISPLMVGASFYSTRSLFISSRAVQGLGAALTLPTGLQLLRARRPTGLRKVIVFTLYATMLPVGLIVGAVGASILAKLTWWSWVYWAYSITLVVLGTISCFAIPSIPQARSLPPGARAAMLELDIPGMITGVAALGLFGFTWCQAHVVGWQQVYLWIVLIMSVVLAALFVIIEISYAPKPLIPCSALPSEVFWILIAIGCSWSCFGIWIVYGWQFVERFRSASPLLVSSTMAGLRFRFVNHVDNRLLHTLLLSRSWAALPSRPHHSYSIDPGYTCYSAPPCWLR